MQEMKTVDERVRLQLGSFLLKSDVQQAELGPTADLIKDIGLTSLQGVEFALDLCDEFKFEFPANFNPFVDDERRRGQTLQGLVKAVERHLASEGAANEKK
jgi:acyl carrier protein